MNREHCLSSRCKMEINHIPCCVSRNTPPPQSFPVVSGVVPNIHAVPLPIRYGFYPSISLHTPTYDVLTYLFSPPESGK
jgi:hypothetical protein